MRMWLAAWAVAPLIAATAAQAQMKQVQATAATREANRAPDLELPTDQQFVSSTPLHDGMLAQDDVAPNAVIGVGLARMSERPTRSLRWTGDPEPTRNPGVSMVLKF